jgi:hypothetical protein
VYSIMCFWYRVSIVVVWLPCMWHRACSACARLLHARHAHGCLGMQSRFRAYIHVCSPCMQVYAHVQNRWTYMHAFSHTSMSQDADSYATVIKRKPCAQIPAQTWRLCQSVAMKSTREPWMQTLEMYYTAATCSRPRPCGLCLPADFCDM